MANGRSLASAGTPQSRLTFLLLGLASTVLGLVVGFSQRTITTQNISGAPFPLECGASFAPDLSTVQGRDYNSGWNETASCLDQLWMWGVVAAVLTLIGVACLVIWLYKMVGRSESVNFSGSQ